MQAKRILVCIFALVLGAAVYAGEQHRMRVALVVDDTDRNSSQGAHAGTDRVHINTKEVDVTN